MTHKSATQPLCRYCGKGIRKDTTTHYFGSEHRKDIKPKSIAEAQRHLNGKIVQVRWAWTADEIKAGWARHGLSKAEEEANYIRVVYVWDGESWADEFFCNGDHAQRFAYVMARAGHWTVKAHGASVARKAAAS